MGALREKMIEEIPAGNSGDSRQQLSAATAAHLIVSHSVS